MLFNTPPFLIFLVIVFSVYWLIPGKLFKLRNGFLALVGLVFYGWWDYRFVSLLLFSIFLDFFLGLAIHNSTSQSKRKLLLILSICINLGFLAFFKYFNFFAENISHALSFMGLPFSNNVLKIVLPVGISFYTFQSLSYTIDIYSRKMEPTKNIVTYAAFVSFFPQLVAGPIERAYKLLPQFYTERKFEYTKALDGLRLILWGMFKKVVIADVISSYVDGIFDHYSSQSSTVLVIGAVFFAFQIYCDFSGYSDIARGTAKLFGFELMINFAYPYFSRSVPEFWQRWHISLSTWFRDYFYIPLGGSRKGLFRTILNVLLVFTVSGFWHGAKWTFIWWGIINGLFFLPGIFFKKNKSSTSVIAPGKLLPGFKEFFLVVLTFSLTCFTWIFFRSKDMEECIQYIKGIFSFNFTLPGFYYFNPWLVFSLLILLVVDWFNREHEIPFTFIPQKYLSLKRLCYLLVIFFIFISYESAQNKSFIYFQF